MLYRADDATLDDLREAVATNEEIERIARRVFGETHPLYLGDDLLAKRASPTLAVVHETPASRKFGDIGRASEDEDLTSGFSAHVCWGNRWYSRSFAARCRCPEDNDADDHGAGDWWQTSAEPRPAPKKRRRRAATAAAKAPRRHTSAFSQRGRVHRARLSSGWRRRRRRGRPSRGGEFGGRLRGSVGRVARAVREEHGPRDFRPALRRRPPLRRRCWRRRWRLLGDARPLLWRAASIGDPDDGSLTTGSREGSKARMSSGAALHASLLSSKAHSRKPLRLCRNCAQARHEHCRRRVAQRRVAPIVRTEQLAGVPREQRVDGGPIQLFVPARVVEGCSAQVVAGVREVRSYCK